jgi:hypothetical protein
MHKLLISVSDSLACRLRVAIPSRQRSKVIASLIEKEIEDREKTLYSCALKLEKDSCLNSEMEGWDITLSDGLKEL